MPLPPPPVSRRLLHEREIRCRGFARDDGLWDIEGHLVDTKAYSFENADRGHINAGDPVHDMWVRVTIDAEMVVHAVEARIDNAPYHVCAEVAPDFAGLAGLKIGEGFMTEARQRFRGAKGCTHLIELLRPIVTTAYQTLVRERERRRQEGSLTERPKSLDRCHALRADGPVVKRRWPDFYTGKG